MRDDAWPRVLVNTVREYIRVLPPRRRFGDRKGPSFRTLLGWFLGGPIFLAAGLQAIWVEPASLRGLGYTALGLSLVVTGVRYALRPATIARDEPEPRSRTVWGRRVGGPPPGPPADTLRRKDGDGGGA